MDLLSPYDYKFPKRAIAQEPAAPRDSAKLLVYNRTSGRVAHDTFKNLADHLPANAVLVFNETKVIPARLTLTKPTGGRVRVLYISTARNLVRVLADRSIAVGMILTLTPKLKFTVARHEEKYYFLKPNFALDRFPAILERYGAAPIPPYIRETPLGPKALKAQYQTVFAKHPGSVAAPTASLHFTPRLLASLRKKGITLTFVTLHVGLGTFAPVTEKEISNRALHYERYEIKETAARTINDAKKSNRPVIAVGTTVVRTLESAWRKDGLKKRSGTTNLFIREGYAFKAIDGMITNFHVPRSSLLMLVSAFAGREKTLSLYRNALRKDYRFFSFGDGMLIL